MATGQEHDAVGVAGKPRAVGDVGADAGKEPERLPALCATNETAPWRL